MKSSSTPSTTSSDSAIDPGYVGNDACTRCHKQETESYSLTFHSKALEEVNVETESDLPHFEHGLSGRAYRIFKAGGKVWHEESIANKEGTRTVFSLFPMKYAIGSGNHSRSYLADVDGFLVESPLTWYRTKMAWDMSPGFNRRNHSSFQRTADFGCLHCHAGRVEKRPESEFRVNFRQLVIGCENCHGPGAKHVEKQSKAQESKDSPSNESAEPTVDTIVNPRHLGRELAEAICSQCHLRGEATTLRAGKSLNDFRPGRPLTDVRIDYFLERPGQEMKVVGHVEQMRLSRCYQNSAELTCTTCHDPHFSPPREERATYFRSHCLKCHDTSACRTPNDQRLEKADNCVACHMPSSGTDIPHFAFTHHRIGLHRPSDVSASNGKTKSGRDSGQTANDRVVPEQIDKRGKLVPVGDVSQLSELERERSLGLAYLELSAKQGSTILKTFYQQESMKILEPLRTSADPTIPAALARIAWEQEDFSAAEQLALSALNKDSKFLDVNATFILGDIRLQQGDGTSARPIFERLTKVRRVCEDWISLAKCQRAENEIQAAIRSLEMASNIDPFRADILQVLVAVYREVGDTKRANECHDRLRALSK